METQLHTTHLEEFLTQTQFYGIVSLTVQGDRCFGRSDQSFCAEDTHRLSCVFVQPHNSTQLFFPHLITDSVLVTPTPQFRKNFPMQSSAL